MTDKIPSWLIGLFGASVIIISTIISSVIWTNTDSNIASMKKEVSELERNISTLWDNHKLSDSREAFADQNIGMMLINKKEASYFLSNAGKNLRGAILSMMVAAGKVIPDQSPKIISELESKLISGDLSAYSELKNIIDNLRLESRDKVNQIRSEKDEIEIKILELENKNRTTRYIFVSLNILGLVIVLLKDLPIWKAGKRE